MKKYLLILVLLSAFTSLTAQTQQGYVKTRGRMAAGGTITPGTRIQGATIGVKGGNTVVSSDNGSFVLSVPSGKFSLSSVKKQGYQLSDPDALSKQYTVTGNDLVIVLEAPGQQREDKLMAERKIRRTLEKQLQEKEQELFELQEANRISQEQFNDALEKLYEDYDNDARLVSQMAERYSKIDYDQIDEFNRQVSDYILNGELGRADSLLNTKGSIDDEIAEFFNMQKANSREKEELKKREENLQKSEAYAQMQLDDLANRCYSKFEIFSLRHEIDSAAYYLAKRSDLDPTNEEWQKASILYETLYIGMSANPGKYYKRLIDIEETKGEDADHMTEARYYMALGTNEEFNSSKRASDYYKEALKQLNLSDKKDPSLEITLYSSLYDISQADNDQKESQKYLSKIDEILLTLKDLDSDTVNFNRLDLYFTLGTHYSDSEDFEKAKFYLKKVADIPLSDNGLYNYFSLNGKRALGIIYFESDEFEEGIKYYKEYFDWAVEKMGPDAPSLTEDYIAMGMAYGEIGEDEKALEYLQKGHDMAVKAYGKSYPIVDDVRKEIKKIKSQMKSTKE